METNQSKIPLAKVEQIPRAEPMPQPPWNFRPTALLSQNYEHATFHSLMNHFLEDGQRATNNGAAILPPKPSGTLRTCQWNIHSLSAHWLSEFFDENYNHGEAVANAILRTESDLVVLNEFGDRWDGKSLQFMQQSLTQHAGFSAFHVANTPFPTAVASRLPIIQDTVKSFRLGRGDRAAVEMAVDVTAVCRSLNRTDDKRPRLVRIYGTHLEASDGRKGGVDRQMEMKRLLKEIHSTTDRNDCILIMGDLNQQRSKDYTSDEWERICNNKARRNSPRDDGVATILDVAGFQCCYDAVTTSHTICCNWRGGTDPPPSTHWSGTVIDYSYSRNMELVGIYVLPYTLSDHRMVVCDWKIKQ